MYFIVVKESRLTAGVHTHFSDFYIYFVPIPDHDLLFLATGHLTVCQGVSSKVARHTPFIALTFYVLTLQITYVLSLLL